MIIFEKAEKKENKGDTAEETAAVKSDTQKALEILLGVEQSEAKTNMKKAAVSEPEIIVKAREVKALLDTIKRGTDEQK